VALTPKCFLCLLAYAGIGATLGIGGPEMCGAPIVTSGAWPSTLTLSGITLGVVGFLAFRALKNGRLLAEARKQLNKV
jgi:primosomal replication protein N